MVLVPERFEGGPVSSRVSAFPDVFSMAEGQWCQKQQRGLVSRGMIVAVILLH